jgi:uncharacterized membrane protein YuzA (DUF378 family)
MPIDAKTRSGNDEWVPPALIALFAALIVLPRLGTYGLWADEGFSVSTSLRSWSELLNLSLTKESNGALYAAILKVWSIGGTSEFWLRLPSAISFIATASMTWFLGRRLHSAAAGAAAGVLVSLHGTLIEYGQNIRFYAPVTAVGVAFVLAIHRLIEQRTTGRVWAVAVLGVCLPLLHLVAGTLLFGAAVMFVLVARESPKIGSKRIVSFPMALVSLLPGFAVMMLVAALVSSRNEGQSINQPLGVAAVVDVIYSLTGSGGIAGAIGYAIVGLLAAVVVRSTVRQRMAGDGNWFDPLVPWVILVTALAAVSVGSLATNLMVGRYVLFLVPFLALLVCIGAATAASALFRRSRTSRRRLGGVVLPAAGPPPWSGKRVIGVGVVVSMLVVGTGGASLGSFRWLNNGDREEWRPLATSLLGDAKPADAVLFANDSIRLFVEYQLRQHPEQRSTAPEPVFPPYAWGKYRTGDQQYIPFTAVDVRSAMKSHATVWLVVERPLVEQPFAGLTETLVAFTPSETRSFGAAGTLYRFDRAA